MSVASDVQPLKHPNKFFIGGEWVEPSSSSTIDVIDSATEQLFITVAEAQAADMDRAVTAAKEAFDEGPWPRMTHRERAEILRALGKELGTKNDAMGQLWPRESGVLASVAKYAAMGGGTIFDYYAGMADTYPFEEPAAPTLGGQFGLLVREPVGVVGAIIPWNAPLMLAVYKIAPALLAGCTIVLKVSPEAPGAGYVLAEVAEAIGLPPGVLNVVMADREVSELLVRDPRVDKIAFTGSTAAGRRIASICGERIARYTLELGGKSAAVILDDADLTKAAQTIAGAECFLSGQVCSSLTRIVIGRSRQAEFVDTLALPSPRCRSATRSLTPPRWVRWPWSGSATGSRATSRRASTRAPRWSRVVGGPSTSTVVTTSSRPCSATSTTTRRSPRRRSSGRCCR